MSKKISGAEYSLSKIFDSEFDFVIPSYQRPYSWTVDQASELFDDLYDFFVKEEEDSYFLGSIVLIKEEGKSNSDVVDGQQRLITLTILLALIASELSGDMRIDFQNYIVDPGRASQDREPNPRLALRKKDRKFFANYVQALNIDALLKLNPATLDNESQKNIQSNSRLLLERLKNKFKCDSSKSRDFGSFLVQRCFLVVVATPNQQSAFRIFSVLNSRGLDLLPSDIVKAEVIGRITNSNQDEFAEKWEELEVQTGRDGLNELFGHIRMIYARKKTKRSLLEEFNEHVVKTVSTPEYLVEKVLEPYADAYLTAKFRQYVSTTNHSEHVNRLLEWLNRIDNSDWLPPVILFLFQQKDQPEYVLWFVEKLERLAAYLHICAKNVNQRIERYAKVIASLHGNHSMDNPIEAIELTAADKNEMKKTLNGNIYELVHSRRRYLILRLDSFISDEAAIYEPTLLTIEHVLPQSVDCGSEWDNLWPDVEERENWVHRIANLVPLTRRRNSSAQNYDFQRKKEAYFLGVSGVSSYALTTQVLNTDSWTPAVVKQRQQDLLDVLIERWELADEK